MLGTYWFCNVFNNHGIFQRADLAIADLTITYDREQAVDFTMPFMNLGELICPKHNIVISTSPTVEIKLNNIV